RAGSARRRGGTIAAQPPRGCPVGAQRSSGQGPENSGGRAGWGSTVAAIESSTIDMHSLEDGMNRRSRRAGLARVGIGLAAAAAVGLLGSAVGWTLGAPAPLLDGALAAGAFGLGLASVSLLAPGAASRPPPRLASAAEIRA